MNQICTRINIDIVKFKSDRKYKTVVNNEFFENVPSKRNGNVDLLSNTESNENVLVLKLLHKSF